MPWVIKDGNCSVVEYAYICVFMLDLKMDFSLKYCRRGYDNSKVTIKI